ncbi:SDR family NAD(P)-dependent oxidoreductase [Streptomyces lutosisoli]|uniref:SDR family NAD(P)-dependent oxidoreductase n=1 Tax=Streptomyces lutosisoli TaxID=2665721 RepID=A0ABW2W3D1_9ACTN
MTAPVLVITGAASGIGEAAVRLYAERGHRVVAVDVAEEGLARLAGLDGVATLVGDVAAEETNTAAVRLALDQFGRLDAAVLNAGIGGTGPLESPGAIDRLFAVNVRAVALGIRAAVPALRAGGGGASVATASVSGLRDDPGTWDYNATKAAVINLVRANAIAPGLTETAITTTQVANPDLTARIPVHRWATPREQAEVIWFLTSPAASYVTGVTVPVDGGLSANGGILLPPSAAQDRDRGPSRMSRQGCTPRSRGILSPASIANGSRFSADG